MVDFWVKGLPDPEFQDSQDQRKTLSRRGQRTGKHTQTKEKLMNWLKWINWKYLIFKDTLKPENSLELNLILRWHFTGKRSPETEILEISIKPNIWLNLIKGTRNKQIWTISSGVVGIWLEQARKMNLLTWWTYASGQELANNIFLHNLAEKHFSFFLRQGISI